VSWITIVDDAKELEPLRRYTAVLMDRIGPFKLRADLDIELSDVVDGRSLKVSASGEDRQVSSRIVVTAALQLNESEGETVIVASGRYEVSGRVATMGSGAIRKKADKIVEEFFSNAASALGG
jgi:carbon monoxide dehydrogenase subunit G